MTPSSPLPPVYQTIHGGHGVSSCSRSSGKTDYYKAIGLKRNCSSSFKIINNL